MRLRILLIAAGVFAGSCAPAFARSVALDGATIADLNAAFEAGTLTSEALVKLCLARIRAYDRQGPGIRAVITLNPNALQIARQLDAERKATGPRSRLHGIPLVLKDNIDTKDMATTGGSLLLEGSVPSSDAFVVKQLRDAGAIILAKVNLSEFASGASHSSLGGQTKNPNDLARTPSGSSGGTGAAVAAGFAVAGLGTDTEGSIRAPSSANGIVGLRPTYGLLSHSGIIPLAMSLDTPGPMARSVYDVAVLLGILAGRDSADASTNESVAKTDYTKGLKAGSLSGARIGVARDYTSPDEEVNWIFEASLSALRKAGATLVDIHFPKWILETTTQYSLTLRLAEFAPQMEAYLATLGPAYPKTMQQLIDRSETLLSVRDDGAGPNPARWALFKREAAGGRLDDPGYVALRQFGLPMERAVVLGMLDSQNLAAYVYPTLDRPELIAEAAGFAAASAASTSAVSEGGVYIPALSGSPDVTVPAGYTSDQLPVGLSFVGRRFDESRLLGLAYGFEQATHVRHQPVFTPRLERDKITLPDTPSNARGR